MGACDRRARDRARLRCWLNSLPEMAVWRSFAEGGDAEAAGIPDTRRNRAASSPKQLRDFTDPRRFVTMSTIRCADFECESPLREHRSIRRDEADSRIVDVGRLRGDSVEFENQK